MNLVLKHFVSLTNLLRLHRTIVFRFVLVLSASRSVCDTPKNAYIPTAWGKSIPIDKEYRSDRTPVVLNALFVVRNVWLCVWHIHTVSKSLSVSFLVCKFTYRDSFHYWISSFIHTKIYSNIHSFVSIYTIHSISKLNFLNSTHNFPYTKNNTEKNNFFLFVRFWFCLLCCFCSFCSLLFCFG